MKDYEIGKLPYIQYIGLHQDELEFHNGLSKRLKAVAYEPCEFEIFYYVTTLLDEHDFKFKERKNISMWLLEVREKITQFLVYKENFLKKITRFNDEFNIEIERSGEHKFTFSDHYQMFITEAETLVLKAASIMDISAQIYSTARVNYVDSFGKMVVKTKEGKFKHEVDEEMQDKMLSCETLLINHKINNKIKHHESLKLYPKKSIKGWVVCLTGKPCDQRLFQLDLYMEELSRELVEFLLFLDRKLKNI